MKIQSLSVAVPVIGKCPMGCKGCVSKLHCHKYENFFHRKNPRLFQNHNKYRKALAFTRDNGCNTMIFTGSGEAILNKSFVNMVADTNKSLVQPFRCIELQTSGVFLLQKKDGVLKNLDWLRDEVGVDTISLSLWSIWSSEQNASCCNLVNSKVYVNIDETCRAIKEYGFILRLSLNMTDFYNDKSPEEIFARAKALGADQITFRKLYNVQNPQNAEEEEVNNWVIQHQCNPEKIKEINEYARTHGVRLEKLPFGAQKYAVNEMSCVVDEDCMSSDLEKEASEEMKYLVLRENCGLYSRWDNNGSRVL